MDLVVKFLELVPRLISIVASSDVTMFIGVVFVVALIVNILCYFIWGNY